MEIKTYLREGTVGQSRSYRPLVRYGTGKPNHIVVLLEGSARRKLRLNSQRVLYENYFPTSFIGLEDYLSDNGFEGGAGVYPGSHYVVWQAEDFDNALSSHPDLAHKAIYSLSRRVRVYDEKHTVTPMELKIEHDIEMGSPDEKLTDAIYQMSFSDDDDLPPAIIDALGRDFAGGDFLMKQGDQTVELYIIVDGKVGVTHEDEDGSARDFGSLGEHDMVGEMAQFDGLPRSASVQAQGPVKALVFAPQDFHLLFRLHPKWSRHILVTLAKRVQERRSSLEDIDLRQIH